MNFVFISPNFPETYRIFCMRLKENGVNVLGIGDAPYDDLHPELKSALTEYYKVSTLENYDEMVKAMGYFTYRYGKIDWLESNNEYWLEQDAQLRTDFNITTGLKTPDMRKYKHKSAMKEFFRKAGLPVARYHLVDTRENGLAFVREVGYPVIVKPDNGVGAMATYRLTCDEDLEAFYADIPPVQYIMEEYVTGDVTTFDGVCNSKNEAIFGTSHISVGSIMDMVNEGNACNYYVNKEVPEDIRKAGEAVLKAFDVKSRAFHIEFFRLTEAKENLGQVGDVVALEVNMRPAGGYTPDMINFANSVDMYQIWADMVAFDERRHEYSGEKSFCAASGRRDVFHYTHSDEDMRSRYAANLKMSPRVPDALSGAMGNQMFIATFATEEEVFDFFRYSEAK